jgi:hypothetical protein
LLEDKYTVIKTPRLANAFFGQQISLTGEHGERIIIPHVYLAKSKHGIYYTSLRGYRLQIWILSGGPPESCQIPEWVLKNQVDLEPSFSRHYTRHYTGEEIGKSWISTTCWDSSDDWHAKCWSEEVSNDYRWDSSDDCVVDAEERAMNNEPSTNHGYGIDFLGYHPHREIVFLRDHHYGFAYYLGSAKLQCLGRLSPACLAGFQTTVTACIYTPCMDDLLPAQNEIHDEYVLSPLR